MAGYLILLWRELIAPFFVSLGELIWHCFLRRGPLIGCPPGAILFQRWFPLRRPAVPRRFAVKTSNLDDHVIQPRRILVHDFAFIFSDHDGIRVAKAAPIGIVDTRLTTEGHALFQDCLVTLGDPG